ncbi:ArsR/SmtB family transcription factor [Aquabacterium sp. OR-4]|uniref:ArsR/SmtB family transcription factor n=1 Tax=Aquabacterium sp. OR-4 TaxID=2978127 RepID=UPI0021B186E9|nr:helix-turn-helix domain-containing protein [Aquabacterium sp. OR-4]MDT7837021.1 helix-turn-helix domain-containing protein [Aquabacterium sp. OR-4]
MAALDEAGAVAALAALAQGARLRIYRALVGAGAQGLTPGALAATLDVPASTLSFHLKELTHAGLVSQEREGRHLIYRPRLGRMDALMAYLTAHCCQASGTDPTVCGLPGSSSCPQC